MMVCSMTRSKVKVKVTSPSKLEILPFANVICSAMYNGSWQLILKLGHDIYRVAQLKWYFACNSWYHFSWATM